RRWLDRCLGQRPEDTAAWRMALEWALAADRPDEVRNILPRLPADEEPEGRALALRAWLAAHRHDREAERRALTEKMALDPGDGPARERLAELEHEDGRTREAEALRNSLRSLDRVRKEYIRLLTSPSAESHAGELAQLAD